MDDRLEVNPKIEENGLSSSESDALSNKTDPVQHPARIQLKNRISFKLARIGVVVAFVLGLVFSSIQVYLDFSNQGLELDAQIQRILSVVERPAARSVHLLDEDLADEVIQGLMEYDFIREAQIVDDLGVPLADNSRDPVKSSTRWITRSINSEAITYAVTLETPGVRDIEPGKLQVLVDVDTALAGFYDRSLFVLTTGVLRNMVLVVLFFLIFYVILTKPLLSIVAAFRKIDPENPGRDRFNVSSNHDRDELGLLAKSGNDYLDANARQLAALNEAQEKLKIANNELEQRVDERTVELRREIKVREKAEVSLKELNAQLEEMVDNRTEELKAAKEIAELASRSKSQFLANMSHELRTPLNAIIGFSRIMKDQMFGPVGVDKYLEYSGDILTSSTHLLKVIGDILDVSKIEAGEMDLEMAEINLALACEVCSSLLNEPIQLSNLTLENNIPDDFPRIYADELRVKQIIINLLLFETLGIV